MPFFGRSPATNGVVGIKIELLVRIRMVAQVPGAKNTATDSGASWFQRSYDRALRFVAWPETVAAPEHPDVVPLPVRAPSFEQKFLFAPCHKSLVLNYLGHALRPDPAFDQGRISSIYYDTPTLDFYEEKRASDYLKTKIRLRWYGSPSIKETSVGCFLEVKSKIGATREKARYPVEVPAAALAGRDLSAPVLKTLPAMLPALGHSFSGAIVPMLTVQYERRRYIEPASGARVAVDTDICCPSVNQSFVPGMPPAFVNACVLEIKGGQRDLPHWLDPIRRQVRRDSFSKYAICFENLLQPTGRRE